MIDNTLYDILGVARDATHAEIRRAYKKLAQSNHPDKDGNNEVFVNIRKAYDVLSDNERRTAYDQNGVTKKVNSVKMDAQSQLINLFRQAFEVTNPYDDILVGLHTLADNQHYNLIRQMQGVEKKLKVITRNKNRVTKIDAGINFWISLIDQEIKKLEGSKQKIKHGLAVVDEVKKMLNEYSCTTEERPASGWIRLGPMETTASGSTKA